MLFTECERYTQYHRQIEILNVEQPFTRHCGDRRLVEFNLCRVSNMSGQRNANPTADVAADLSVPERVLLFCLASGTKWAQAGITSGSVQPDTAARAPACRPRPADDGRASADQPRDDPGSGGRVVKRALALFCNSPHYGH
jgi:hypothetical protein